MKWTAGSLVAVCAIAGCSRVTLAPEAWAGNARSLYLVTHEDPPGENDEQMRKALEGRGPVVTSGPSDAPTDSDLLIKYDDRWVWDVGVFLRSLEIQVFDGHAQTLLATARWSDTRVPYQVLLFPLFVAAPWGASSTSRRDHLDTTANELIGEAFAGLRVRDAAALTTQAPPAIPASGPPIGK